MNKNRNPQRTPPEGKGGERTRRVSHLKFPYDITRWFPLLLIVITFGVYFQNVFHEFTYDDRVMVLDDPLIWQTDIEGVWSQGGAAFWLRQIRTLTFMADYAIFGFSPTGYHLHNLFWHLLCVWLVFFLLKKISQQGTFSFFGALIFALHPIQVEAVSNITNRKEMLALGFLLIAFLCYIRFLEATTAGKWGWLLSSVLSWVIASFSKQVAIVLPPILVAYEFLIVPRDQRFLTRNIPILFGLIVLGSLPLLLYAIYALDITNFDVSKALERTLKGYRGELTYIALVATSARAFWTYIQLLVWPAGLCPNHLVDLSTSFLDFKVLLAWFGLIAFIMFSLWVSSKWPVLAFGMLWFTISFIPISNWLPSAYILADRYMYMPSVGYSIVLVAFGQAFYGWLVRTRPRRANLIASFLAVALTISYTSATLAYNHYWGKQETLMTYMLQCNPISPQAHEGLGYVYLEEGMPAKAVQSFSRSIELGGMNSYSSRGNAYYQLGQYQAAIKDYNQAIALKPKWVKPYNNRGTVFYEMGEYEAALKDYNQAISIRPKWGEPYYNRGILYLALNKYDSATKDFTQALGIFFDKSRVYNARGLAYEKLNNWTKAQEDYAMAITSDPSNGEAYFNLGRVQLHNDEIDAAILSYKKAKELGWEQAEAVLQVMRKKGYLP